MFTPSAEERPIQQIVEPDVFEADVRTIPALKPNRWDEAERWKNFQKYKLIGSTVKGLVAQARGLDTGS